MRLAYPLVGVQSLRNPPEAELWSTVDVDIVRDLNTFQKIVAVRAAVFMSEQSCPYDEEYDGNDLSGLHLLASIKGEPVATLRLRWFAGFGKIERVCALPGSRGSGAVKIMLAHALEIAARKGYRMMLAQIQARLWPLWSKVFFATLRTDRPAFSFSDFDYQEMEIPVAEHPQTLTPYSDPYVLIRPEGEWDAPGILDVSSGRDATRTEEAA